MKFEPKPTCKFKNHSHVCAYQCAQLLYTIQHKKVLVTFPANLQTIIKAHMHFIGGDRKGKEEYLYSAFYILCISQSTQAWITQFYLQIHHACFSFISVHQMASPLTEVRDIQSQLTTHLSTPKG